LPTGFSFTVTVGPGPAYASTFTQNNFNLCINSNTGNAVCDGTYMGLPAFTSVPNAPTQCTPANCLANNGCSMTPPGPSFTYVVTGTAPNRMMTTVSLPNTPLTTCTSLGQPNPITFTWVQQ
jgi:hypothetical protein